jgi:hypothetical protein
MDVGTTVTNAFPTTFLKPGGNLTNWLYPLPFSNHGGMALNPLATR